MLENIAQIRLVPRLVYQTYGDLSKLPFEIREKNERLEVLNPEYTFIYFDDNTMLQWIERNCSDREVGAYRRINPNYGGARADLFRYLIVHQQGGVYLDIKSTCTVPFDSLIRPNDYFILSHWPMDQTDPISTFGQHKSLQKLGVRELQQWFLVASPRSDFLEKVIDQVVMNIESNELFINTKYGKLGALELTGPIQYTKTIYPLLSEYQHRVIDSKKEGLVYSIYYPNDPSGHLALFKSHYSRRFDPIIKRNRDFMFTSTIINRGLKQYIDWLLLKIYSISRHSSSELWSKFQSQIQK